VLRESGYEVLVAADGREGLDVIEAHDGALDLMVTDVVMPEMNGYQLAARAAAIRPQLRIALMSGFGAGALGDQRLHAVRAELPLIEKPFDAGVLLRRVAELLSEPPPSSRARGGRRAVS
jgi:DNA-binding response OmpR family regulator